MNKTIIRKQNQKIAEVRSHRDFFGILLYLVITDNDVGKSLDLAKALSYPILKRPACYSHSDGTICTTEKSVLFKELEKEVPTATTQTISPPNITIIDGMAFLYKLKDLPHYYEDISKKILKMVLNTRATEVRLVFDRYENPSIKDYEHKMRGSFGSPQCEITRRQKRYTEFSKDVTNIYFKQAFVQFLIEDWTENDMAQIIGQKIFYVDYEKCYRYTALENRVIREEIHQLSTLTLEADNKLVFHACSIRVEDEKDNDKDKPKAKPVRILIEASDTDVLIIMLANMRHLAYEKNEVWMRAGNWATKRYINISDMYKNLGQDLASALPGIHAISGCDYNPATFRIGKKLPFQLAKGSPEFLKALRGHFSL